MEELQRSFRQLGNNGVGGAAADHARSETLYDYEEVEVDRLSSMKGRQTTTTTTTTAAKEASSSASYHLSGVGDLMLRNHYQRESFRQVQIPISTEDQGGDGCDGDDNDDDLVVEEVIDDDDGDPTEFEYYEDSEIEEIELDDDLYEDLVESSSPQPPPPSTRHPTVAVTRTAAVGAAATSVPVTPSCAGTDEENEDDDDDDDQDPPPSREEVAEAITYMVRQEKVVEYGLLTKGQVDEMNDLPLEEMMEIMKHFEICDNNNATIQWDLVLAMINPDYSPDAPEDEDDGVEDAGNRVGGGDGDATACPCKAGHPDPDSDHAQSAMMCGASSSSSIAAPRRRHGPMGNESAIHGGDYDDDDDDDVDTNGGDVVTAIHQFALMGTYNDAASQGSSYSLDVVDQSEGGVSVLTAADGSDDEYVVEETFHGSMVSMDPLIRATYTKSMVELKKSHSLEEADN